MLEEQREQKWVQSSPVRLGEPHKGNFYSHLSVKSKVKEVLRLLKDQECLGASSLPPLLFLHSYVLRRKSY